MIKLQKLSSCQSLETTCQASEVSESLYSSTYSSGPLQHHPRLKTWCLLALSHFHLYHHPKKTRIVARLRLHGALCRTHHYICGLRKPPKCSYFRCKGLHVPSATSKFDWSSSLILFLKLYRSRVVSCPPIDFQSDFDRVLSSSAFCLDPVERQTEVVSSSRHVLSKVCLFLLLPSLTSTNSLLFLQRTKDFSSKCSAGSTSSVFCRGAGAYVRMAGTQTMTKTADMILNMVRHPNRAERV